MVAKKEIMVDLTKLKVLNCGLGQVAYNFGQELSQNNFPDLDFNFLTPPDFRNHFGNKVKYTNTSILRRTFPCFNSRVDLWHATHQDSGFMPNNNSPYLLTVHDLNFLYEKSSPKAEKYLNRLQQKIDRACALVAISEFTATEMKSSLNLRGKTINVIHNGVRLTSETEQTKPSFVESNRLFFFSIGQIVEKKNFHVLLDVMKLMPDFELYICGEQKGEYALSIQKRIESEKIDNVKLTGSISSAEKNWMYHNCHAFLFPSKFEGFGLPVIEAMLCGKPVFSSDKTSLKEIGGEFAYFWRHFDPVYMVGILQNGLEEFYQSPTKYSLEKEYALSFSYHRNTQAYLQLYRDILNL